MSARMEKRVVMGIGIQVAGCASSEKSGSARPEDSAEMMGRVVLLRGGVRRNGKGFRLTDHNVDLLFEREVDE
jgi:hypothetical protein